MTITLLQLWMPIVLGTFLAWIASALIHVVAKYHNSDYHSYASLLRRNVRNEQAGGPGKVQ